MRGLKAVREVDRGRGTKSQLRAAASGVEGGRIVEQRQQASRVDGDDEVEAHKRVRAASQSVRPPLLDINAGLVGDTATVVDGGEQPASRR